MFTKAALLVVVVLLAGCVGAVKKKVKVTTFIPRQCLDNVRLTDDSYCERTGDKSASCKKILIDINLKCEQVQVTK